QAVFCGATRINAKLREICAQARAAAGPSAGWTIQNLFLLSGKAFVDLSNPLRTKLLQRNMSR
ncbi:MAG: hypothetical protein AAF293_18210, partial [Pseudomonadota bacterium]